MAFKLGDIVVLKSGGPNMTVADVNDQGDVYAKWFRGDRELDYAWFPWETVEHQPEAFVRARKRDDEENQNKPGEPVIGFRAA